MLPNQASSQVSSVESQPPAYQQGFHQQLITPSNLTGAGSTFQQPQFDSYSNPNFLYESNPNSAGFQANSQLFNSAHLIPAVPTIVATPSNDTCAATSWTQQPTSFQENHQIATNFVQQQMNYGGSGDAPVVPYQQVNSQQQFLQVQQSQQRQNNVALESQMHQQSQGMQPSQFSQVLAAAAANFNQNAGVIKEINAQPKNNDFLDQQQQNKNFELKSLY